jgi:hypothetical protein
LSTGRLVEREKQIYHSSFAISHLALVDSSLKCNFLSAKGADWKSQGQVLSIAKHVAPGTAQQNFRER